MFNDTNKFIKLLNPTDFSFYSDVHSEKIYIVYFVAKIFIGFGIYQLIQAFRKYRQMSTQSEQILENQLVEQLNGLGFERLSIPNEAAIFDL